MSGDDSESAKTKIQQLKVSFDEAKQDLQDTEYEKWISDQQEMLDSLYNEYHDFVDDHMNDTDVLLKEIRDYLSSENIQSVITDTLKDYADKYEYDPSSDFKNILDEIGQNGSIVKAINDFSSKVSTHFKNQSNATSLGAEIESFGGISELADYNKAKSLLEQYNNSSDEVKGIVSESAKSKLSNIQSDITNTETGASNALNAINAIGNVTWNSAEAIQKANAAYNALSNAGKALVNQHNGLQTLNAANKAYAEIASKRNEFDIIVKDIYWSMGSNSYKSNDRAASGDLRTLQDKIANIYPRGDSMYITEDGYKEILRRLGYNRPEAQNAGYLLRYMSSIGFSHGGVADTLQKVPGMNGDDGWITVKQGEAILTPEQTEQFRKLVSNMDVMNPALDVMKNLSKMNHNVVPNQMMNQSVGDIHIDMSFPNVTNYEQFRKQMQSDPKIEKMFKSMIWDKNSFSKYKITM